MDDRAHLRVLKRVGIVLVVVGLLYIGLMVYSIAKGVAYSSSLNVFALIAGIFLIRGARGGKGNHCAGRAPETVHPLSVIPAVLPTPAQRPPSTTSA